MSSSAGNNLMTTAVHFRHIGYDAFTLPPVVFTTRLRARAVAAADTEGSFMVERVVDIAAAFTEHLQKIAKRSSSAEKQAAVSSSQHRSTLGIDEPEPATPTLSACGRVCLLPNMNACTSARAACTTCSFCLLCYQSSRRQPVLLCCRCLEPRCAKLSLRQKC